MGGRTTWMLLSYGDDRKYAGNRGYSDKLAQEYEYDSLVPNHKRLAVGDLVVVAGRDGRRGPPTAEGLARVVNIRTRDRVNKEHRRCPVCDSAIEERRTMRPRYRCSNGHELDEPKVGMAQVTLYTALFGDTYVPISGCVATSELKAAQLDQRTQNAIRPMDLSKLLAIRPEIPGLNALASTPVYLGPLDGRDDADREDAGTPYEPTEGDRRARVMREIKARRGQAPFRRRLLERFQGACAISGCAVADVLEAAHISPYRGDDDNRADNGLLLRADLHTLFDLDLVGIDPETLEIHLHPALAATEYGPYQGKRLARPRAGKQPSRLALRSRWEKYQARARASSGRGGS